MRAHRHFGSGIDAHRVSRVRRAERGVQHCFGKIVGTYDRTVIFITAKFHVLADHADHWAEITHELTQATRDESGNLWFDWSRGLDDPTEYVLVEAFRDGDAGAAHVQSDHFKAAIAAFPKYLVETPRIISQMLDQDDWSELGEMKVG